MSLTISTISDPLGSKLIIDTDCDETPEQDVTGASTTIIYAVEIDNTANTAPTYVKLWNNDNAASGTTKPTLQFRASGGAKETYIIGTGTGSTFVELSFWAVTSPFALSSDDSAAATGPASKVPVKILCT
tara:strand:- start:1732 stop:2121 length:390 start_codon:yes stop_codon:yes gene_type:complete